MLCFGSRGSEKVSSRDRAPRRRRAGQPGQAALVCETSRRLVCRHCPPRARAARMRTRAGRAREWPARLSSARRRRCRRAESFCNRLPERMVLTPLSRPVDILALAGSLAARAVSSERPNPPPLHGVGALAFLGVLSWRFTLSRLVPFQSLFFLW